MMKRVPVVFVSADPLSASPSSLQPRLRVDEDLRGIREKVAAAKYRDVLHFDVRPAARLDDLVQALSETVPQIVHFSGHGGSHGLMLAGADGITPHELGTAELERLFKAFQGDLRIVVLSACSSHPQAEAIAQVVGCAIGTRGAIADDAAIAFNAAFYQAIAFGESAQVAYDRACAVLAAKDLDEVCPELLVRRGVDASNLFLIDKPEVDESEPDSEPHRRALSAQLKRVEQTDSVRKDAIENETKPRPGSGVMIGVLLLFAFIGAAYAGVEFFSGQNPRPNYLAGMGGADTTWIDDSAVEILAAARELHRTGNYTASFPRFKHLADLGNAEAMGFVGLAYLRGQGIDRDPDLTAHWLSQAADARDARGMNAYGLAYEDGFGVGQSYRWARHWYEAAATEKNDVEAMRNLGRHHRQGLGIGRSDSLALHWYRKAVDAGSVDAMVDVGLMYAEGVQGRRDTGEALRWLQRAAQAGSSRAMHAIGRLYEDARDYAQALAWYQKAADAGYADAMNNLGVLYQNGWGVAPNRAQAARWYRQAAEAGSPVAAGNLRALEGG